MEEENKVVVHLQKELLSSEKKERKRKIIKRILIVLLCIILFVAGGGVGFYIHYKFFNIKDYSSITVKFNEIISYMYNYWLYADQYEDLPNEMIDRGLYGMTNFDEDPYTTYLSKSDMTDLASSINMDYVGIGVQYTYVNNIALVSRVFIDSPAERGGILAGDIIVKVDDLVVEEGVTSDDIKAKVVGEEGTNVNITVLRDGKEIVLKCVRGKVDNTCYAYLNGDTVILEIFSFGENTATECIKYLNQYKDKSKIIIDLRNNGGGYQSAVQEVSGLFLGKNKVVFYTEYADGSQGLIETIVKKQYKNFKDYVILINENTASASEVLTLALKDQLDNVTIVGVTSYGKGIEQSNIPLSDGSYLKFTTNKWLSPKLVCIQGVGIEPDVYIANEDVMYEAIYQMEDDEKYEYDSVSYKVRLAQMCLDYLYYDVDRCDGYFSESTKEAIINYQIDHDLNNDGVLNKATYDAIISSVLYEYNTIPERDIQLSKALEVINK